MIQFSVNRAVFMAAIGRALGIARRGKKTMPIIDDTVLLDVRADGSVSVSSTDLDITITSTVNALVHHPGRMVPTASTLYEALRSLTGETVVVAQQESGGTMTLREGGADFDLVCAAGDGYPSLPVEAAASFVTVEGAVLSGALRTVLFSASHDESRPNICGLYLSSPPDADGKLVVVTTDGHRLSREQVEIGKEASFLLDGVLLPTAGATELARIDGELGITQVGRLDNNLVLRAQADGSTVVLFVRLIDANFPDYRQVVPKPGYNTKIVTLNKARLVQAFKRMKIAAASQKTLSIRLRFDGGQLEVRAENPDRGKARDAFKCDWPHDPFEVGVSADYVREAVESIAGDTVQLRFTEPLAPLVVHGEVEIDPFTPADTKQPPSIRVVMPMRI